MILKRILYCAVLSATVYISACESRNSKSNLESNGDLKSPTSGEIVEINNPACYLSHCFETISMSQIIDPKHDYVYPDPKNLIDENKRPYYQAPKAILDLKKIKPETQIAPNFKFGDFMLSGKGQYGFYSSHVVTQLQLMRNSVKKQLIVNSGYRSPGYNRRTDGSAQWSRHTYGDAVDFFIPGRTISSLTSLCEKFGSSFSLTYEAHIHCDWRKSQSDPAFFNLNNMRPDFNSEFTISEKISEASHLIAKLNENVRVLTAQLALDEDDLAEGPLTYRWTILWPNGTTQYATTETLELPVVNGRFYVALTVGGSIHLERAFEW